MNYERYFIEGGARYHHIINPKTGMSPKSKVQSVSILGPSATLTDALSTTVFVLGVDKGLELIDSLQGFDAIILTFNLVAFSCTLIMSYFLACYIILLVASLFRY